MQAVLTALALRSVAEYEGEFVADASDGGFLKGTQWLVWKFESDATLADACQVRLCKPLCVAVFCTFHCLRHGTLLLSGESGCLSHLWESPNIPAPCLERYPERQRT